MWRIALRTGAVALVLALFIQCGVWMVAWYTEDGSIASLQVQAHDDGMVQRVYQLWQLAELSGVRQFNTMVMVHGSIMARGTWHDEVNRWREAWGMNPLRVIPLREQEREVYRDCYQTSSYRGQLRLFRAKEGQLFYTVKIQGSAKGGMAASAREGARLIRALSISQFKPSWNVTVQTVTNAPLRLSFNQAEKALRAKGRAKSLDRYEDGRTISVTYETDYMGGGVHMKHGQANLQLAVHENRERGETRISLGTPLIAGEY